MRIDPSYKQKHKKRRLSSSKILAMVAGLSSWKAGKQAATETGKVMFLKEVFH